MNIRDSLGAQQQEEEAEELIPIATDYKGDTLYDHEANEIQHYEREDGDEKVIYNFKESDVYDFIYFLKNEDKDFILENFGARILLNNPVFERGIKYE